MNATLLWNLDVHFEVLDRCYLPTTAFLIGEFYPCRVKLRHYGRERLSLAIRKQRVQDRVRLKGGGFCTENRKLLHVEVPQLLANLQQKF